MIRPQSYLNVADNSGARKLMCIQVLGGQQNSATIGDVIIAVVKDALPNMPLKKSEIVQAVIVRTNKGIKRKNGLFLRFDENAAVIINKEGNPRGTRIFGPIARELRENVFIPLASNEFLFCKQTFAEFFQWQRKSEQVLQSVFSFCWKHIASLNREWPASNVTRGSHTKALLYVNCDH